MWAKRTDTALHATRVFPPLGQPMNDALFLLATAYRSVYAVAGSYLAARLAPDRPMRHALALGAVGVVLSTAGAARGAGGPNLDPPGIPSRSWRSPCRAPGPAADSMACSSAHADGRRRGQLGAGVRKPDRPGGGLDEKPRKRMVDEAIIKEDTGVARTEEGDLVMADASAPTAERVSFTRLLWVGPLTILAAVVANVAFVAVANPLFGVAADFPALTKDAVAAFTAVCVLLAVLVFALVARFSRRPISLYRRIAIIALILSFVPDIALGVLPNPVPVGVREVLLLMATHVIAAAVTVGLLTSLARAEGRSS